MKKEIATVVLLLVAAVGSGAATSTSASNEAPLVDAGLDQRVTMQETVLLDGGGSRDPDGEIASYHWEIIAPDGTSVVPACPSCERTEFVPNKTGVYEVVLTATDDDGASRSDTLYVTVEGIRGPTVVLSGPASTTTGDKNRYTATVDAGEAKLDEAVWRIDGTVVSRDDIAGRHGKPKLRWTFNDTGRYTVSVTAIDEAGRVATDRLGVTVGSGGGAPDPNGSDPRADELSVTLEGPDTVWVGDSVAYNANVTTAPGQHVKSYDWSGVNATWIDTAWRHFDDIGTYEVWVEVTDLFGNTANDTIEVAVVDPLSVDIAGPDSVESGTTELFEAEIEDWAGSQHDVTWSPADGSSAHHLYTRTFDESKGETVEIAVTVENELGHTATDTHEVNITESNTTSSDQPDAEPKILSISEQEKLLDGDGPDEEKRYTVFDVEVYHDDGQEMTVVWEFDDGMTFTQAVGGGNGSRNVTFDRVFYADSWDGVGHNWVNYQVTVIDQAGVDVSESRTFSAYHLHKDNPTTGTLLEVDETTVTEGSEVEFTLTTYASEVVVNYGDGTSEVIDVYDPSSLDKNESPTVKYSHTYSSPGNRTVQVRHVSGDDQTSGQTSPTGTELLARTDIVVVPSNYTAFYYEVVKWEVLEGIGPEPPDDRDWERDGFSHTTWEGTGDTAEFEANIDPNTDFPGDANYTKIDTWVEEQTETREETEPPWSDWELVEENVSQEEQLSGYDTVWTFDLSPYEDEEYELLDQKTVKTQPAEYEYKVQTQKAEYEWVYGSEPEDYIKKQCSHTDPATGTCLAYKYYVQTQEAEYEWQSEYDPDYVDKRKTQDAVWEVKYKIEIANYETIYYHKYELTTNVTINEWELQEEIEHYHWKIDERTNASKYSLTRPTDGEYIPGTLAKITYECQPAPEGPYPEEGCEVPG